MTPFDAMAKALDDLCQTFAGTDDPRFRDEALAVSRAMREGFERWSKLPAGPAYVGTWPNRPVVCMDKFANRSPSAEASARALDTGPGVSRCEACLLPVADHLIEHDSSDDHVPLCEECFNDLKAGGDGEHEGAPF